MSTGTRQRCAIYTRKSSDEGLEQDFNSLDAQREACEAFVISQAGLGYRALSIRYDDGGFSGGTMERPALKRLLVDIEAGQVDVVVVYKIDRLTRALSDFARIVELFDARKVSFVSVTQPFNTTSSMGRLTLNVLLSFAQFEREVTAERIRDKIAASKRKGIWMGGLPPLGYDVVDKALVINPAEAETVSRLFQLYLSVGSVRRLKEEAERLGLRTKQRTSRSGASSGGGSFSRGHLHALLSNPLYAGKVRHQGQLHEGRHAAIVDQSTFDAVQALLMAGAPKRQADSNHAGRHLLTGLIYDETGDRLSPSHATKKGRRYRYYISHRLMQGRRRDKDGWRIPAREIETIVCREVEQFVRSEAEILALLPTGTPATAVQQALARAAETADQLRTGTPQASRELLRRLIQRIELSARAISIHIRQDVFTALLLDQPMPMTSDREEHIHIIETAAVLKRRGVEARFVTGQRSSADAAPDRNLCILIARAHRCLSLITSGACSSVAEVADAESLPASEVSRILPLAFLAPDIVRAILHGTQPVALTAERLKRIGDLPTDWPEQRQRLGF